VDTPNVAITAQTPAVPGTPAVVTSVFGEYLPTSQLKLYTGRSAHRFKVDRMNGMGCPYVRLSGRIYYRRCDLDAYMARHLIQPKNAA
jgi:hypothetical protein